MSLLFSFAVVVVVFIGDVTCCIVVVFMLPSTSHMLLVLSLSLFYTVFVIVSCIRDDGIVDVTVVVVYTVCVVDVLVVVVVVRIVVFIVARYVVDVSAVCMRHSCSCYVLAVSTLLFCSYYYLFT